MPMFTHRRRTLDAYADVIDEIAETVAGRLSQLSGDAAEEVERICRRYDENNIWRYKTLNALLSEMRRSDMINLAIFQRDFRNIATSSRYLDRYLDRSRYVKLAILEHPKVTVEQVTFLSDHPDVRVSSAARNHPKSWVRNVQRSRS